jgi:hypothetical protein
MLPLNVAGSHSCGKMIGSSCSIPRYFLLDCKPRESTGEELERLLTSSHLASTLRREVFAEASQVKF